MIDPYSFTTLLVEDAIQGISIDDANDTEAHVGGDVGDDGAAS